MAENARAASSWESLVRDARAGAVTLILGAGVSRPSGVPTWTELADALWEVAFDERLPLGASDVPQFEPFVFELVERALGRSRFERELRRALYARATSVKKTLESDGDCTLGVVASAIVREIRRRERHLVRVLTFNVDDVLERALRHLSPDVPRAYLPITRVSHHPERIGRHAPIPIYHLHGFVPSGEGSENAPFDARDSLVFTDLEYWGSVAVPNAFANRVMSFALHDSHCIFLGLSMTDLDVLRWLALRAHEVVMDAVRREGRKSSHPPGTPRGSMCETLDRHYWIRPEPDGDSDAPVRFLTECLQLRGVRSVPIASWTSRDLAEIFAACFPDEPSA